MTDGFISARASLPTRRRTRGRAYLLLARVSNLPTVWSNVMAGTISAAIAFNTATPLPSIWVVVAASLFYTGGMMLNDAFDAPFDRVSRPERPIPNGDVSVSEVFVLGAGLVVAGLALLAPNRTAVLLGIVLAAAIVFYDAQHKGRAYAPVVMGSCRGLVYLIAAAAAGGVTRAAVAGALIVAGYVAGLTVVAKRAGADSRWLIPALIAGISILDAVFILVVDPSSTRMAVLAALGCPLTLSLQRWVPGD